MAPSPLQYISLPNRGLISVSGRDCLSYMQGLITNDIALLEKQPSLYTCLLTPNGKFLFDFFIYQDGEKLLLDCEGGERAEALLERLQRFKLRSDVSFEIEEDKTIYLSLSAHSTSFFPDPRHPQMGARSLTKPEEGEEPPFEHWDKRRIELGIPDGSRDMIPEKSTLLECNIDRFHGVSFDKGCYMGQELTARMHYRGLTKKTLLPVQFQGTPPAPFIDIRDQNGKLIGEMRSSCGDVGLVLIKKDTLEHVDLLPFTLLSS